MIMNDYIYELSYYNKPQEKASSLTDRYKSYY